MRPHHFYFAVVFMAFLSFWNPMAPVFAEAPAPGIHWGALGYPDQEPTLTTGFSVFRFTEFNGEGERFSGIRETIGLNLITISWTEHWTKHNATSENLVGLALMFSTRIRAYDNLMHNNATHGMLLVQVTRSEVKGNSAIGNSKGLFVYNSLYNDLSANLLARNQLGMHYWGGSEDNQIRDNAFIENQIQVKFVAAFDQPWQGNFWRRAPRLRSQLRAHHHLPRP